MWFILALYSVRKQTFIYARENKDKKIEENEKTKEKRIDRVEVYVTVEHTVTITIIKKIGCGWRIARSHNHPIAWTYWVTDTVIQVLNAYGFARVALNSVLNPGSQFFFLFNSCRDPDGFIGASGWIQKDSFGIRAGFLPFPAAGSCSILSISGTVEFRPGILLPSSCCISGRFLPERYRNLQETVRNAREIIPVAAGSEGRNRRPGLWS